MLPARRSISRAQWRRSRRMRTAGARTDFVHPLVGGAREPEHLLVEADVAGVHLDECVGAVMHLEHVHAGDVKDRAEKCLGPDRFVDRELGEFAQLAAALAQTADVVRVELFHEQAVDRIDSCRDRRDHRVPEQRRERDTAPRLRERLHRISSPSIAPLEQRGGSAQLLGVASGKDFESVFAVVFDLDELLRRDGYIEAGKAEGSRIGCSAMGMGSGGGRVELERQNFSSAAVKWQSVTIDCNRRPSRRSATLGLARVDRDGPGCPLADYLKFPPRTSLESRSKARSAPRETAFSRREHSRGHCMSRITAIAHVFVS